MSSGIWDILDYEVFAGNGVSMGWLLSLARGPHRDAWSGPAIVVIMLHPLIKEVSKHFTVVIAPDRVHSRI